MDDEDGMESFEVDDMDLEFAMNPGRRVYQSKNQATYGVWADKESDDDDDGDGAAYLGFRKKKGGKNYSAPVQFISGGIKPGSGQGDEKKTEQSVPRNSLVDDSPINLAYRPPPKKKAGSMSGANVFAGMRSSAVKGTIDESKFADWAKHGKGSVIMQMMASMGYKEGKGLGSKEQGIVEPVQASVRKGRGAVGAYGREQVGPKFGESAADAQRRIAGEGRGDDGTAVEQKQHQQLKGSWKKDKKVKTRYRTMDEVIEEGGSIGMRFAGNNGTKVIDMTGPEQRVYSGYDSFSMKQKADNYDIGERKVFDVPELMHNLNLLVDVTEESIRRNNHQLRGLQDQTTAIEYDLKQVKGALTKEEAEVNRMNEVYGILEKFSMRNGPNDATINDCQELMIKLKSDYYDEYRLFRLENVAIACVLPLIVDYFSKWRPLDPDHLIYGVDLMKEWRDILVGSDDSGSVLMASKDFDSLSAYDRLIWEGWLPSLRRAVLNWDPRDQMEGMIRIVEIWQPVLPNWIKENIWEQVIIPRISDRVASWDPLTDEIPIHSWLVPWLAVLGDRLQSVMAPIRQKLAKALRLWAVTDKSALAIIRPWVNVWSPPTMAAFLGQNIVPKLERALESFELDPGKNPKYPEWNAVMVWLEMINPGIICDATNKFFFPRWYDTLCIWLDSPGAVIEEATRWYFEWQGRVPSQIKDHPVVADNLRRAMIAIASAKQGRRVSRMPPPPPPMAEAPPPPPPLMNMGLSQQPSLTMRDVIERKAMDCGLTYVPQRDRFKDGRQVYWFGPVSIYFDREAVFAMDTQDFNWRMVRLGELLHLAGVE